MLSLSTIEKELLEKLSHVENLFLFIHSLLITFFLYLWCAGEACMYYDVLVVNKGQLEAGSSLHSPVRFLGTV